MKTFSQINRDRCESPDGFNHPLSSWSMSDWMTATMSELGEAANIAKKLNRVRDGIPGNTETEEELRQKLADEIADTAIYLDLMAQAAGFDLETIRNAKFAKTSAKIGYIAPDEKTIWQCQHENDWDDCMKCAYEEPTERMHTPGPWQVMAQNLRVSPGDPRNPELWQVPVQQGNGNALALVFGNTISGEASKKECLANAQLMAAAPDLLAVLQAYEQWEADLIMCDEVWRDGLPKLTQELCDRMIEIQTMRNAALEKGRGE